MRDNPDKRPIDNESSAVPVLIAGRPGRIRESLRLVLGLIDEIYVVGRADDSASARRMILEREPNLVLLDANLPGDGSNALLEAFNNNGSRPRFLVLVDSSQGRQEAYSAGADVVLIKGFRTAQLIEVVTSLLDQMREMPGREPTGRNR